MNRITHSLLPLALAGTLAFSAVIPVHAADIDDFVTMNDSVSFEMTDAEFWIDRYYESTGKEEAVVRSKADIANFNANNPFSISSENYTVSIYDLDDTIDGNIVRELVAGVSSPSDPSSVYLRGKPTTRSYWDDLENKLNLDAIPDTVDVRYGFSTARSSLRIYPSADFIGEDKGDRFFDVMVMSEYMPFQPLVIVHETEDGEWSYVLFDRFCGWVQTKYVAECADRDEWLKRQEPKNFLMVTGKEIRLQADQGSAQLSNQIVPMGTKLPLLKRSQYPDFINDRETTNCYVVKLPTRGSDGMIVDRYSLISINEDVHIGYLEYTRGNILRQAFKFLGDRYGWAGMDNSNDCSGITGEIYRCFGINLPRVSSQIADLNNDHTYEVTEKSAEQKAELLKKLPVGSILFFKGHIMIYAGIYNGDPYCISATGTYITDGGESRDTNSVIITNMNDTYRANGNSWLENLQKIVVV